ncbi:5220_t:CDS:2, partial [Gigaspora margarita]
KIKKSDSSIVGEGASTFNFSANQIEERTNIFYDPLKVKAEKVSLEQTTISEALCRNLKDKQIIASVLTDKMAEEDVNIKGYHYIFDPQCFKNALGETMVDLYTFPSSRVTKSAKIAVEQYYVHMLDNPSYQSKEFKKELVEHFGTFIGNNNELYTTANTASSHNRDHLKLAVNFNIISQFHRDLKDHRDSFCVICPLGIFKGGQLVFPELKLVVYVKEGQAVAFRSNILVYGNFPVLTDVRHSIVFFIYGTMIKQNRNFRTLFHDTDPDDSDSEINV